MKMVQSSISQTSLSSVSMKIISGLSSTSELLAELASSERSKLDLITVGTFCAGFASAMAFYGCAWGMRSSKFENENWTDDTEVEPQEHPLETGYRRSQASMLAVASGEDLRFDMIDASLLDFLEFSRDNCGQLCVDHLLPPSLSAHHHRWVAEAAQSRVIPARLQHPLRNVQLRRKSGSFVRADLNVEVLGDWSQLRFLLKFRPHASTTPVAAVDKHPDEHTQYADAFVVALDVVEFTSACSKLTALEVLAWMKVVRKEVEGLLLAHHLRLIETRGDSYLAVTTEEDAPEPAARTVAFAAEAAAAVAAVHGTRIRVGVARGPVTMTRLPSMGGREVLCLLGGAVAAAQRLEQCGGAAFAHLAEDVAAAFAEERGLVPPPCGEACLLEGGRSARWYWQMGAFDSDEPASP